MMNTGKLLIDLRNIQKEKQVQNQIRHFKRFILYEIGIKIIFCLILYEIQR